MRKFKNTIMVLLAILPFVAVLSHLAINLRGNNESRPIVVGTVSAINDDTGIYFDCLEGSLSYELLSMVAPVKDSLGTAESNIGTGGFSETTVKFFHALQVNAGIVPSLPLVFAYYMMFHILLLTVLSAVLDLIMFIPTRLTDFLGGV